MLLAKLTKPWVAALLAVEVAVEANAAYELAALAAEVAEAIAVAYDTALLAGSPTLLLFASKYIFAILL